MNSDMRRRIDNLYRGDCAAAWCFVLVLWLVVGFVLYQVTGLVEDNAIRGVLITAAALLLLFNTASIGAMVRHYGHDKQAIYGIDIRHLDEHRERIAAERRGGATAVNRGN